MFGMSVYNIVKVTTFLTDIAFAEELGSLRAPFLENAHRPRPRFPSRTG